jgi:hypothetical protein
MSNLEDLGDKISKLKALEKESANIRSKLEDMDPIERQAYVRNLKKQLDAVGTGESIRASLENIKESTGAKISALGESIDARTQAIAAKRKALRESLEESLGEEISVEGLKSGKGRTRVGILIIWTIVTIVFLVLTGLIFQASRQDTPALGLFVTLVLLQFFNLVMVFLNKTVTGLIISMVSFIIGLAFLIRSEEDLMREEDKNCAKDKSKYKIYIACHAFNVALLFFSLMRILT